MGTTKGCGIHKEVDIVVKVDEFLDEQNKHRLEYYLLKSAGIIHAQFDRFRQQLLIIGYDPAQTSSAAILKHIKQQRLNAQLVVGM